MINSPAGPNKDGDENKITTQGTQNVFKSAESTGAGAIINSQQSSSKDGSTPMDLLGEFKQLKEVEDFQAVNNAGL